MSPEKTMGSAAVTSEAPLPRSTVVVLSPISPLIVSL